MYGQGNIAEDIGLLIQAGKMAEAEELTNRYLTEDPTNVDAIVMKGNVLLNKYLLEQQALLSVVPRYDESVYNMGSLELPAAPVTIPKDIAEKTAKLWRAAATLDPSRSDLQFGLCQIYSLALMKDELLAQLPTTKEAAKDQEDLPIHLTAYARNLQERDDFEGAMETYRAIGKLFPNHPGLLSDMAGEYFFAGQLDSARHYIALSMDSKNAGEATLGNAFFFRSLMGDYDGALAAIRRLPGEGHLLYEGLLKLYRNEKKWEKPLENFLASQPDSMEEAAVRLLLSPGFQLNMDNYLALLEPDLGDGFKILIHQKFRETGAFLPHFNTAEAYCFNGSYASAAAVFAGMEKQQEDWEQADRENFHFYYAWALHKLGQSEQALAQWQPLLASEDFYKQSAAAWFTGKYHFDKGEKAKAREYFSTAAARPSETKFATMCWDYMGRD
jgi:hypothetical protein